MSPGVASPVLLVQNLCFSFGTGSDHKGPPGCWESGVEGNFLAGWDRWESSLHPAVLAHQAMGRVTCPSCSPAWSLCVG